GQLGLGGAGFGHVQQRAGLGVPLAEQQEVKREVARDHDEVSLDVAQGQPRRRAVPAAGAGLGAGLGARGMSQIEHGSYPSSGAGERETANREFGMRRSGSAYRSNARPSTVTVRLPVMPSTRGPRSTMISNRPCSRSTSNSPGSGPRPRRKR